MARVFSGIKPTGEATLGSLLGALHHWVVAQNRDAYYCVVDLHALTSAPEPLELTRLTMDLATMLLAVGLRADDCTLFIQSHVHEHTELAWLMECTASFGELRRMTQFKEKSEQSDFVSGGLFTYPALMAADILLYRAEEVPVGDDQRQHVELSRTLATRFNHRYGDTFVVPEAKIHSAGARVMDLQEPTKKMSKSDERSAGAILVLDDLKLIERKIKRAVTDTETDVRFDPKTKPGVSNLLSILAACTDRTPESVADDYSQYGPLKADTASAVVETVRPIQERYRALAADPAEIGRMLEVGAAKAQQVAMGTLARAKQAIGLVPRGGVR